MTSPLVSVVIAAWNAERYFEEALASVVQQTWSPLEIVVVDDGSTDGTAAVAARLGSRVKLFRRPHQGLAAARNFGISNARGDYIALLDADDVWNHDKLKIQMEIATRHPGSGAVICDGIGFEGDREVRPHLLGRAALEAMAAAPGGEATGDFHRDLITGREWAGVPAQVLLPRHVVQRIGPFADLVTQDTDYWLRVSQHYPLTFHRDKLVRYRVHGDGMSGSGEERTRRYRWSILSMLAVHQHRCTGEERRLVRERVRRISLNIASRAFEEGRQGQRGAAARTILRTFRYRPWHRRNVAYLTGLALPGPVQRLILGWLQGLKGPAASNTP